LKEYLTQALQNIKRSWLVDLLVLTVLWLVGAVIVDPRGNFPLNDDWVYGWPIKVWLESSRFEILSWTGVSLIGHVFWGFLFCSVFGFSFTVLRISMLLLGLAGVLTTYHVLTLARASRSVAFLAALTLAFNPLYYELSFTFMTDVSFLAFVLVTLVLLFNFLENGRLSLLIGATVAAAFSTLIRDVGVLLPAVFGLVLVMRNGLDRRTLVRAPVPLVFSLGAYLLYRYFVATAVGSPSIYDAKIRAILSIFHSGVEGLLSVFDRFHCSVMYLGLFLAPFIVVTWGQLWRAYDPRRKWWWGGIAVSSAILFSWRMLALGKMMPLSKNVLFDFGLGPPTLRDVGLLHLPNYYRAPQLLWFGITVVALVGACVALSFFMVALYEGIRTRVWKAKSLANTQFVLVVGVVIGYLGLVVLSGLFDRYVIFLVPFCLLAMHLWTSIHGRESGRTPAAVPVILIVLSAVFAVGATHDYLSWNRERWVALDHLTKEGYVSPQRIDGGVEFNGWLLYDKDYVRKKDKSWWWVVDDEYLVSFGPVPGYDVEKSYPFTRLMPPGQSTVMILRRSAVNTLPDTVGNADGQDHSTSLPPPR
jgi:4-amino-4-deoxy-L-arabinose transferase-like glycosyltransferase